MTSNLEQIPFFFIIGRPRSGTTLLRSIFDAHPNVVLPFESPVILNLYKKYKKHRQWDDAAVDELYADLEKQPYFERWRVDKEDLRQRIMSYQGEISFQVLVRLIYLGYQSVFDKGEVKWFGDKNPVYSFYADRLYRMFPDAKFIHITRDYRDNLVSLKQVTFEAPIPALIAYRWVRANKLMDKIIRKAPKQVYRLRYEDLAASPEVKTKEICNFLGIEFFPEQLEYRKKLEGAKERAAEYQIRNHQSLMKPVNTGRIAIWKGADSGRGKGDGYGCRTQRRRARIRTRIQRRLPYAQAQIYAGTDLCAADEYRHARRKPAAVWRGFVGIPEIAGVLQNLSESYLAKAEGLISSPEPFHHIFPL